MREDLYFRLGVLTIEVPPLRDRKDDILLLCHYFTKKYAEEYDKPALTFSDRALEILSRYSWPGNVRELENLIQRLIIMTDEDAIDVPDLPAHLRFSAIRKSGLNKSLAEVEANHIHNVIISTGGNKTKAAEILGIDRKTLREKLKKFNIN